MEPAGSATRRSGGDGGGGDRGKFSADDTLPTNMGVIITDHGAYAPDSPSKADVGGGLTAEQKAANAAREHYDLGLRLLHIAETTFEAPAIYSPFIKFSSVRSVAESAADAFLMAGKCT
ncbi:hypothetical protein EON62_03545 [archaeon]|nr:MAG: hypothetical protein EON62_03545 [archaeon]